MAAIQAHLDFLVVLVLAFTTAFGGGVIRDLLIGATPPAALRDWRYSAPAFAGGAITFLFYPFIRAKPPIVPHRGGCGRAGAVLHCRHREGATVRHPTVYRRVARHRHIGGRRHTAGRAARPSQPCRGWISTPPPRFAVRSPSSPANGSACRQNALGCAASRLPALFLLRLTAVRLHWHLPVLAES